MTSRIERAIACHAQQYNCAQAVFSTYAPSLGISEIDSLKVSAAFGGGMGRLQEVCGAVTGAFVLIGCKYGMVKPGEVEAKEETYSRVKDFARRFTGVHGTISCRTLLGCDLNTTEGKALYTENDLANTVCNRCIRTACAIIEETVMEEGNRNHGRNSTRSRP
jgi:C_GCAxxG_C_C family probable redox protein